MESLVLGVILVVAVGALVWMVLRQIRSAGGRVSNPACAGCPFEPKCEMQDRPHGDGSAAEDAARPCGEADAEETDEQH